jgi:hypothetical protein
MNVPKTADEIKNEIYLSSDKFKNIGDLRIQQLIKILTNVPDEIIIEGIVNIFEGEQRESKWFQDQEFSGKVLEKLKPKSKIDATFLLKKVLKNWDKSVEQLPNWFKENYGPDGIMRAILDIENSGISDIEKDKINAMKYWLQIK